MRIAIRSKTLILFFTVYKRSQSEVSRNFLFGLFKLKLSELSISVGDGFRLSRILILYLKQIFLKNFLKYYSVWTLEYLISCKSEGWKFVKWTEMSKIIYQLKIGFFK